MPRMMLQRDLSSTSRSVRRTTNTAQEPPPAAWRLALTHLGLTAWLAPEIEGIVFHQAPRWRRRSADFPLIRPGLAPGQHDPASSGFHGGMDACRPFVGAVKRPVRHAAFSS